MNALETLFIYHRFITSMKKTKVVTVRRGGITDNMELKELTDKMMQLLEIKNTEEMSKKLFDIVRKNNISMYEKFDELVENDLSVDWMQKIFQYYQADRKEKKQYYTPRALADFIGRLAGNPNTIIDLCAGSGALTIQKWNQNHDIEFVLYEFDENVLPFLLFNMALRNIKWTAYHSDVLQAEIFHTYKIIRGDKYGVYEEVEKCQ